MSETASLPLQASVSWAPRDEIAPVATRGEDGAFVVASNGSEGCYGGWNLSYPAPDSPWVRVRVVATPRDLARGMDCLHAAIVWDTGPNGAFSWEPLLPVDAGPGPVAFEGRCPKPPAARGLQVRLLLAWSGCGEIRWSAPEVFPSAPPPPRRWRLGAMGGALPPGERSIASNTRVFLDWCRQAAAANVGLLCLPEVMLSLGLPSGPQERVENAVRIPGPEIEQFQEVARQSRMALCFSVLERNAELLHNTAVLIDQGGELVGRYRKVHLASPLEGWGGVTPGNDLPVYEVNGARVGMNICMDSSALESARVPARRGAEILCLPIMGDHRAVRGWAGNWIDFDVERWIAIQRVRAMDNQLYLVISRNNGVGTGIFSPRGEVLALSGGNSRLAYADVDLADLPRTGQGATFRGVAWWERRPPAYRPLLD